MLWTGYEMNIRELKKRMATINLKDQVKETFQILGPKYKDTRIVRDGEFLVVNR
jgi:hypothetical protein